MLPLNPTTVRSRHLTRQLPLLRRYSQQQTEGAKADTVHGSGHWLFERLLSMASLGLVGGAAVVDSPMATGLLNLGLGIVIPLHLHLGFGAIITDYLPLRKFPVLYRASRGLLYACTALTLYGLYRFNTEDIGIIEGVKMLWHAKRIDASKDKEAGSSRQ